MAIEDEGHLGGHATHSAVVRAPDRFARTAERELRGAPKAGAVSDHARLRRDWTQPWEPFE
jgi:hypothetical protein